MTTLPSGADTTHGAGVQSPVERTEPAIEHALVPVAGNSEPSILVRETRFQTGSPIARLPVELNVVVPVRNFRVRNLLALDPGQVVETNWSHGEDLPLTSGSVQLAWSEFEVVDTHLAVRVTRLA